MERVTPKPPKSKLLDRNPLLVPLSDAGLMLGVSARTVRRMSQEGKLPRIVKVGHSARISWQGIMDYYKSLCSDERGCLV